MLYSPWRIQMSHVFDCHLCSAALSALPELFDQHQVWLWHSLCQGKLSVNDELITQGASWHEGEAMLLLRNWRHCQLSCMAFSALPVLLDHHQVPVRQNMCHGQLICQWAHHARRSIATTWSAIMSTHTDTTDITNHADNNFSKTCFEQWHGSNRQSWYGGRQCENCCFGLAHGNTSVKQWQEGFVEMSCSLWRCWP